MKYKIKIPEDGDLKWDDVMMCEHLSVAKSMDGNEVECNTNPDKKWAIVECYGLTRRFPWGWLEEVETMEDAPYKVFEEYFEEQWGFPAKITSDMKAFMRVAFNDGRNFEREKE